MSETNTTTVKKEELDLYICLLKKHFPNAAHDIMSDYKFFLLEKIPLAIKLLEASGFTKEEAERNVILSLNPHLKDSE